MVRILYISDVDSNSTHFHFSIEITSLNWSIETMISGPDDINERAPIQINMRIFPKHAVGIPRTPCVPSDCYSCTKNFLLYSATAFGIVSRCSISFGEQAAVNRMYGYRSSFPQGCRPMTGACTVPPGMSAYSISNLPGMNREQYGPLIPSAPRDACRAAV